MYPVAGDPYAQWLAQGGAAAVGPVSGMAGLFRDWVSQPRDFSMEAMLSGPRGPLVDWARSQHPMTQAALATAPIPVVGDLAGLAADARMYASEPESRTLGNAGLSMLGLLPFVPGMAGIIAGRGAKTADFEALARAEALEQVGKSAEDVFSETGWFRGAGGDWQFEIPDYGVPVRLTSSSSQEPLSSLMAHEALFEAYPDLANTPVRADYYLPKGTKGRVEEMDPDVAAFAGFPRGTREIVLGPDADSETVLHELQHIVQRREGFPIGGSPQVMARELNLAEAEIVGYNGALREVAKRLEVAREQLVGATGADRARAQELVADLEEEYAAWLAKREEVVSDFQPFDAYKRYRRLAGEVEARNVASRASVPPGQDFPPFATEDTSRLQQIVRRK